MKVSRFSNSKIFNLWYSFLFILIALISCEKDKTQSGKMSSFETAKLVSQVTSGLIASDQAVKVVFNRDMIDKSLVGQSLTKNVFEFDPSIDGITRWENPNTLIFKPNRPLPFREIYTGKLDLVKLFPEYKDKDPEPLEINLEVAGREIKNFSADLKLVSEDDPKFVYLDGEISFTEPVDLKAVNLATKCRFGKSLINLEWKEIDDKNFKFSTKNLERKPKDQSLLITIDKNPLEISYNLDKTVIVPSLSDLKVTDIIKSETGQQPDLKIEFSDELKSEQDLRGLIAFDPDLQIDLKTIGKTVLIKGPFEYGQTYFLKINPGIRSKWATSLKKEFTEEISFEDILPDIKFASEGVFLTSSNLKKIRFMSVNVRKVEVSVKQVFENNLGQFLQMEEIDGSTERRDDFYNISRVGVEIAEQELEIGETKNEWLQHEIDLSKLIQDNAKGLYIIGIRFQKEDMIYDTSEENLQYRRRQRDYYYNDPSSGGYLWYHGRIYKPIVVSDIGMIYKHGEKQHQVFATNLINAMPMSGVKITLRTYQNQVLAESFTDGQGVASFNNIEDKVFYVEGEKGGQRSFVKPSDMQWNLSTFDTGGDMVPATGIRSFIYADRGVHRPGDTVYLSAIFRNENNTFPENHPVMLEVKNPKNQTVYKTTNKKSIDGFYTFQFGTKDDDLTGNYTAVFTIGTKEFHHNLRIETVVPERLKVEIETQKKNLTSTDDIVTVNLSSNYLFGNPAANLEAEVQISLSSSAKTFQKYRDYNFTDQSARYETTTSSVFKGKLDAEGKAIITWQLPDFSGVPSEIDALIKGEVWEKGGRSSKNQMVLPIDPYAFYVGIKRPDLKYWYAQTGQDYKIPVIMVTPDGKEIAGKTLRYRIYKNNYHWWWEYDSRDDYRLRFKKDHSTELVSEGSLVSGNTPVNLNFRPEERGEYLVEVQDGNDGHTASFFISAYPWGESPVSGKDAGILAIRTDKEKYNPGQSAVVSFPVPKEASVLVTIEKGDEVMESRWYEAHGNDFEMNIPVPVTEKMLPTAYVSVAVLQPHAQTANDRPIRMYGVVPINVEEASTHQELSIIMPDKLQPEKEFTIEIQTNDHKPTQLTIAIVDEGLLSLTRFKTPDAWINFFRKQGLGVQTADLFNYVIGANKGDVFKTFSIGGGMEGEEYREGQLEQQKAKRFKPVVMFEGPIMTDKNGKAKATFTMPNYIGAIRVMVVSATANRYGKADKTVPVRSDLMVLPTLPRVIGPKDKIVVPVTVFAMKENLGLVKVSMQLEGPLASDGVLTKEISFDKSGEKDVNFEITAKPAVGVAKIRIEAASQNMTSRSETEISVRSSSPRITETQDKVIEKGSRITFTIPDKGLEGSNKAVLCLARRPNLKLNRRILWLIRYPYGCIEQTVSSVFPQLYLMEFLPKSRDAKREIDKNINAAIQRLRKFQLASGGFGYWPGAKDVSAWGTNYAGHFMIEAKNLGYSVPDDMFKNWQAYQKSQVYKSEKYLMVQVYRNYTLALSGEAHFGGMNLLMENQLNSMSDVEKWMLAAGYSLAGADNAANRLLTSAGLTVKAYEEFGGTYGSTLRDKSIILEELIRFERWNEANKLASEIAEALSTNNWYSTQTTAFMLMALGKYFKALSTDETPLMSGIIILPDGSTQKFETEDISYQLEIESGFGKDITIEVNNRSTVNRIFADLEWSGLPLEYLGKDEQYNLNLKVEYLDNDGMKINPDDLTQGASFWIHFQAGKLPAYNSAIEEVALVQVLPAGWEIDNTRLSGEEMPGWMRGWKLNREDYLDIRDDRVMWFFDFNAYDKTLDFVTKVNAVTVGEFVLPPVILEAMYNNNYRASRAGMKIEVEGR